MFNFNDNYYIAFCTSVLKTQFVKLVGVFFIESTSLSTMQSSVTAIKKISQPNTKSTFRYIKRYVMDWDRIDVSDVEISALQEVGCPFKLWLHVNNSKSLSCIRLIVFEIISKVEYPNGCVL